jgi:hypothetical protein
MQVFLRILMREILASAKRALSGKSSGRFSRIRGSNFTLRKKGRDGLLYEEPGRKFLVSVVEGGGYSIHIEQMGEADFTLDRLPVEDKLRIARNIRGALLGKGIDAEIVYEHRILRD